MTAPGSFQYRASSSVGTFQDDMEPATFAFSSDWWPMQPLVDQACAAEMLGETALTEIRTGVRGPLWEAIESAEGGRRIAQCIAIYDVPASPDPEPLIQMNAVPCGPLCIEVQLWNIFETAPADLTQATFTLESFLVDCVGLPPTLAPREQATCTITDYVTEGFQVLNWYGFAFLGQAGWGVEVSG